MTNFAFITAQTEQMSTGEAITSLVISLIVSIPAIIALWKVYTKAGEPGWKILIPIYDLYTLCKIADGNGWKFLLFLIPFVNIVCAIILNIRLAKSFGKGVGFGIGSRLRFCTVYRTQRQRESIRNPCDFAASWTL